MHCRVTAASLASISKMPGASLPPAVSDKKVSRHCQMFTEHQNHPWLRTKVLDELRSLKHGSHVLFLFIFSWHPTSSLTNAYHHEEKQKHKGNQKQFLVDGGYLTDV